MIRLTCGTYDHLLPADWEEAGPIAWDLLRDLARLPPGAGKLRALRRLSKLSPRDFARFTADDLAALDVGTPWLDIGTPLDEPIKTVMRQGWKNYHWPGLKFIDGQALAFAYADEYYEDAITGDAETSAEATRNLLATLARPLHRLERRPVVSRAEIEARAGRFRKLPPEWYAQALMYWTGVKLAIHDLYGDYLFPTDATGGTPSTAPSFGWWSVFQDVAEAGAFGDLAAVHGANFHDVCQYLARREGIRRDQQRAHEAAMQKK